jgi:hypothetical protein
VHVTDQTGRVNNNDALAIEALRATANLFQKMQTLDRYDRTRLSELQFTGFLQAGTNKNSLVLPAQSATAASRNDPVAFGRLPCSAAKRSISRTLTDVSYCPVAAIHTRRGTDAPANPRQRRGFK